LLLAELTGIRANAGTDRSLAGIAEAVTINESQFG